MAAIILSCNEQVGQAAFKLSQYVDVISLNGSSAVTVTVPSNADIAIFSCDQPKFYVNINTTAAAPTGTLTDGTASALNPTFRMVNRGTTFSVFSPTAGYLHIEWYTRSA